MTLLAMPNVNVAFTQIQLQLLMDSMRERKFVTMTGTRTDKGNVAFIDTIIDVVNAVEVEDGSGNNYIVHFMHGQTLYSNLSKAIVVRDPVSKIVWHNIK